MRTSIGIMIACLLFAACSKQPDQNKELHMETANITKETIKNTINSIEKIFPDSEAELITKGVEHAASLWRNTDGSEAEFKNFCEKQFIGNSQQKSLVFEKISRNLEVLYGHFNKISLDLQKPLHQPMGEILEVDKAFGAYNPNAHLNADLYRNKLAFTIALNFPYYSLEEKDEMAQDWSRLDWAYARLGDRFASRIPSHILQKVSEIESASDIYISDYNIYMGNLTDATQTSFFPKDMVLLSHWNLRDEIKSQYSKGEKGLASQAMIYQVMKRIIDQSIPQKVINNDEFKWDPYTNVVYKDGKGIEATPENNQRYQQILNNFHVSREMDQYATLNTAIRRAFEGQMEITQKDAEKLFVKFLSSKELKNVAELIKQRLGRDLKPWDIWYDGFKSRSSIDEDALNTITQKRYPNAKAFDADLPNMLVKLGFSEKKAHYLAEKIDVDPARGSGHAWGAGMKGETAHLRTRIPETGMNYKGYNIAIHEFGHNVEQTISLYDVDHYLLNGVPNTAFTEALAFIFQSRDLELLGIKNKDSQQQYLKTLDSFWSTYEIMGVSLLDQRMWKWLYANTNATAGELKDAVEKIAKEIWNDFYAPVFGMKDEPILAVYSHMISNPLYLSNYAFGQLIQFQVEQHLDNSDFAAEVQRLYRIGCITPGAWMQEGVGKDISIDPLVDMTHKAVKKVSENL
ncbi:hypothetical protein [Plebeiibacterium marinum]|uniref:Uncharacterized protein n=1 Tax=Plebeiibacterium marinum TaxID=2992111 RepID=A0AAE3SLU1_9BACT|nr:hypothetical protein [Plebeiobacterium marinum]MCW3807953.1 hypothetical protein [Plebeiobacterium marinum]